MDVIDDKIIKLLKENSKLSLSRISELINLSIPSVRERILKLQDQEIIQRYTIDIDYKKMGYEIEVIIELIIKNNLYADFKTFISQQDFVDECFRISGDSCFIFKAHFKSMTHVEDFIDIIQQYGHSKTHFIFSQTK
ncbi:Lrp/AsnC family transcriptional regulator [Staphylococcus pasteuri]|uniref:Lrp/AsnC family transcriptional regulator n=1 Tax=Staphylococcus pasteuri TaxID=45972 RepID=UPI003260F6F2